ncbi:unnamed protein product [Clonostachys rosea f. rosea IK726]|uniref:Uncharacterized protein n=1 Tax=Clonostachys rosea f. rosea IK726 TaxID=1349383 RepID=A0ACA9TEA0_BIOOC|nr:unnamed protein product [Clonostachys rosea f. rosea IK726]
MHPLQEELRLPGGSLRRWLRLRIVCEGTPNWANDGYANAVHRGFNGIMNKVWDANNRGRQWKDIRHKYVADAEEDEE